MRRLGPAMIVVAVLLSGCTLRGLSFRRDERVSIVTPAENDEVTLPLELRWTAKDFDGYFGVFFDRSPMGSNKNLLSLVPESDPCRSVKVCPDAAWLADHNMYVTKNKSLTVSSLVDRRDNNRSKDRHEVTVVLLDGTGRRLAESAFIREFIVDREDG